MPPDDLAALFDADAHPLLLEFAGKLGAEHENRVDISQDVRARFRVIFDAHVEHLCDTTGMTPERAAMQVELMLGMIHHSMEQERDSRLVAERERHAQAIRRLLSWWQQTAWNPANAKEPPASS